MGESRALKITRMGDVVLTDTGDGVFTGREPHNTQESNETPKQNCGRDSFS